MYDIPRHKVFVSYHHYDDEHYKDEFISMMEGYVVDKSVDDGDIDPNLATDTIRQKIRDDFIADATVTVVLIGKCTWQRKHVDWEIGSSLRNTQKNPRCGLLGILLPNHWNYNADKFSIKLIPPRLADNCPDFAKIHNWSNDNMNIREWIHEAFENRHQNPYNSRIQFSNNRTGNCADGWQ